MRSHLVSPLEIPTGRRTRCYHSALTGSPIGVRGGVVTLGCTGVEMIV
ncbi:MAG: hypothetical protein F6K26_43910, partial [Moorea sp. SIO2I5]|nr:hypothetical protein [Moorena sp. SIO2I5]